MRGPYQHSLEEGAPALVSDCHHWLRVVEQRIGISGNGVETESRPGQCGQELIGMGGPSVVSVEDLLWFWVSSAELVEDTDMGS